MKANLPQVSIAVTAQLEEPNSSKFHHLQDPVTVQVSSPNVPIRCKRKRSYSPEGGRIRLQGPADPCGMNYGTNVLTLCTNALSQFSLRTRRLYVRTYIPPSNFTILHRVLKANALTAGISRLVGDHGVDFSKLKYPTKCENLMPLFFSIPNIRQAENRKNV